MHKEHATPNHLKLCKSLYTNLPELRQQLYTVKYFLLLFCFSINYPIHNAVCMPSNFTVRPNTRFRVTPSNSHLLSSERAALLSQSLCKLPHQLIYKLENCACMHCILDMTCNLLAGFVISSWREA